MSGKRNIFEEVGDGQERRDTASPRRDTPDNASNRGIRIWLMLLFGLLVLMIAVGGMTRLTDSGLSITEWRPVTGAIPPLNAETWAAEFEKYKAIPEYQLQNRGMELSAFKAIYWWEWGHRQLGRIIGLVWAVGFLLFLARRAIPRGWTWRLLGLGALGGLQGAIGWWMVSSGLTGERLDVASYRLATHLGLAFLILGMIVWFVQQLAQPQMVWIQARRRREAALAQGAGIILVGLYIQIIIGALVAGIDAGLSFTDWPLMGGGLVPPDAFSQQPVWRNFFENGGLVQFIHRMWGYGLVLVAGLVWWRARRSALLAIRRGFNWMALAMLGQVILGILTVVNIVPWQLAILHQFGAVLLLTLVLRARHLALYPPEQRIARA